MNNKDIADWLMKAFPIRSKSRKELNFPCPKCQHHSFYFNPSKRVGYCHFAGCHWRPNLQDMVDIVGYGPEEVGYVPTFDSEDVIETPFQFPIDAHPIVITGTIMDNTAFELAHSRIRRGRFIEAFRLHANKNWIYIPVFEDGKVVQYVGRAIRRFHHDGKEYGEWVAHGRRYDYFPGIPIQNFIFNWDEVRTWTKLTLMENTFNAIRWRGAGVTSNFGSNLSDVQIQKIVRSRVKIVSLLWDGGAEKSAQKACDKLQRAGIRAIYGIINGQPDDMDGSLIPGMIHYMQNIALKTNERFVDFRRK